MTAADPMSAKCRQPNNGHVQPRLPRTLEMMLAVVLIVTNRR